MAAVNTVGINNLGFQGITVDTTEGAERFTKGELQ